MRDRGSPGWESHEPGLTIVIPSYDSAPWLPATLTAADRAIARSPWTAEIVVVDDGSRDDTSAVLGRMAPLLGAPLRVVHQANSGRFLARWAGVTSATAPLLLLLDSRVMLGEGSLSYLHSHYHESGAACWNGHVPTDTSAPLVGRFWEVPTHIFWGGYLAHPRPILITAGNFDRMPKGTGCFVVPREMFAEISLENWPKGDPRLISDDTRLIRGLVAKTGGIMLDPSFSATYRPRGTVGEFLHHAGVRGSLFIDSYAGTGFLRDAALVALVGGPLLALVVMIVLLSAQLWVGALLLAVAAFVSVAAVLPAVALLRNCPPRAALAFLVYSVPFGVLFWTGLLRGSVARARSLAWRGRT